MKIKQMYMIERSDKCMGEWRTWRVDGLYFATEEKAEEWIKKHRIDDYTCQYPVKRKVITI